MPFLIIKLIALFAILRGLFPDKLIVLQIRLYLFVILIKMILKYYNYRYKLYCINSLYKTASLKVLYLQ